MPPTVHQFAWPDRLVVGTVGRPGSRAFYLQVRDRARILTIALEKEQSAVLAEKIDEVLDGLRAREGNPHSIPDVTPAELVDNDPLEQPIDPRFRTGAMSLGWDPSTSQVVIEAYPIEEADDSEGGGLGFDDDAAEPSEVLLVQIPVGAARAFAKRTLEVVGAGRPLCALCGTPMDPEGHTCPVPGDTE
jgi:uncharacterized repeat protein (TIGR03847 family)